MPTAPPPPSPLLPRPPPARFAHRSNGARNGCAQAAALTLLAHHGRPEPPLAALYRRFPPDTPFGLLGTSPRRLAEALRAAGLPARPRGHKGGAAARSWLERELADGRPAALLLDLRHLGRRLPGGHWIVAYASDTEGVHVTNLVRCGALRGPTARVPWAPLLRAWRCTLAPFPSWHYAAVSPEPTDAASGRHEPGRA